MPRLLTTVLMDQVSEHQRDLTNSASGRFVSEFVTAFAYTVRRLTATLARIKAKKERMAEILEVRQGPGRGRAAIHPPVVDRTPRLPMRKARVLARQSRVENKSLTQVIREDRSLDEYLQRCTPEQRQVLEDPAFYTGASSQRTQIVCDNWERKLHDLEMRLTHSA